ncbi:uncharacterized protein LAJ45_10191 [Morchella importuna]|uniref:uncharacterized protein n=1 Tax=Morchella importuna TaxID=1174673 RepID=UPI001E8D5F23|nr:uncharacterized protein LAJ45_10848 [Morchella importuna]XP_045967018.1 uncharacterized protein LAJ45_10191 [Morchella importuna]KAH8145068.1 hypothetical protein LAJ45_10848 [Morchella importuna]KAH8145714.1 hypothetical protein LAJ45_10191 [Morchella importuna]
MKSSCPFCSKRYSSSANFDKHLRTTHPFEADEWLGNQFLLLERDQEAPDDTHDSPEGIHDSYSDAHDDSDSSESNSINYHDQDPDNNSDLESESYFMMEETDGDANRHEAATTIYEGAGERLYRSEDYDECSQNLLRYPWHPFNSAYEFRMARYFILSKASQGNIDSFFLHAPSSSGECSYRTGRGFIKRLDEMNDILGKASWHHSEVDIGGEKIPYYYRDPMVIVRYLLGQRAFRESLVYAPVVEHNESGERMYGEMHTGDWWWETQVCGDKKAWPIYLTIGNIKSSVRSKPTGHSLILLGLLPVPPKLGKNSLANSALRRQSQMALHRALGEIFQSIRECSQEGELIACADGYERLCFPVLSGWIADQPEHSNLQNISTSSCPRCEVEFHSLGSTRRSPTRDHEDYRERVKLFRENPGNLGPVEYLVARSVKTLFNAFWGMPRVNPYDLNKPDILHNIYLGMLKHMMEWVQAFLKKHNRLEEFDKAWASIAPYPGLAVPNKAYRATTQWQGKEMRNLGRVVLGALAAALRNPGVAVRGDFAKALKCVRGLIDFHLMAQYGSHTTSTLNYMESYLEDFHKHKDIFLEFRAYKRTVKDARDRTKAVKTSGSQSAQRGLEEIREIRERSHFNFIKLHVLTHYREHVERFGSIPQYSTDISELAHVRQIKEAYGASNKVDAATQILDYGGRRLALEIRMLNLKDIVGGPESTDDILWSHRDNLKELLEIFKIEDRKKTPNERSIVEGRLPLRRLCNPSTKSERLFNIADGLQISHTTLYRLIKEYAEDAGCSQSFAGSSESILERRVEMFTCLQVPIPIFQRPEVYEVHNIRCTGNAAFRKGKIRKDWVWVSVASSEEWGVFRGRLPGRVEALFKLRDSGGRAHRLCIVELLEAKDRGIADSSHGLLKVCRRRRKRMWVVNIRSILGMAHLFEVETGNWLVNTRIDLRTWNEFS